MKVCVINGSPRKNGNTYRIYKEVERELKTHGEIQVTEFNALKDFPENCVGCYNCINKSSELKCPHRSKVEPIEQAIIDCDVLVLLSPVYTLSVSGQMKSVLDHFAYRYVIHRPHPSMRTKSALVISCAAGNAMRSTNKLMAGSLKFWGIPKIQKIGLAAFALNYDDMADRKKKSIERKAKRIAKRLHKNYANREKQTFSLHFKFFKTIIKPTVKSYGEGNPDYDYWNAMGWL